MALAPLHKCNEVGCNALVRVPRCEEHKSTGGCNAPGDPFYSGRRWRKLREKFLSVHPICTDCNLIGRTTAAVDVHHKARRRDSPELAYEWSNLDALCHSCHSKETRGGG